MDFLSKTFKTLKTTLSRWKGSQFTSRTGASSPKANILADSAPSPISIDSLTRHTPPQETLGELSGLAQPSRVIPFRNPASTPSQLQDSRPPTSMKENALSAWHGVKLLCKNIEKFLDGTPFKIPLAVINTLIETADNIINNQESIAILIPPICQRLQMVVQDMPENQHLYGIDMTCQRFSEGLQEAVAELQKMRDGMMLERILNVDENVEQIENIFRRVDEATKNFQLELTLVIVRQTGRIKEDTEMLRLERLRPIKEATYGEVALDECIKGTREMTLQSLLSWCKDTSLHCPSIRWLNGMAGTGKSTIAYTICARLNGNRNDAAQRLCASFFCSRQVEGRRIRRNIIPTIAYSLALSFPAFGRALLDLQHDALLPPLKDHIRSLLIDPLKMSIKVTQDIPPLVVIIDALDEIEDEEGSVFLHDLISELAKEKDILRCVKFFVTSRRDPRLLKLFTSIDPTLISVSQLEDLNHGVVIQDIQTYLQNKLPMLTQEQLYNLADQASGLFIYAATVVRFVRPAQIVPKRLELILEAWPSKFQRDSRGLLIDHIYEEILRTWLSDMSKAEEQVALSVLETVIHTVEPVLVSDIPKLLGDLNFDVQTDEVLSYVLKLHAVLFIRDGSVYCYHKSFVDFMLDHSRVTDERLAETLCSTTDRQLHLSTACFQLMESLEFNICKLPSSFLDDSQVGNLQRRVDNNIPSALRYACRHWATHISNIGYTNSITMIEKLRGWFEGKFLFWIEVMNLLDVVGECYHLLVRVRQWFGKLEVPMSDDVMNDFLSAESFATTFAGNIILRNSTPHLYVSALAMSSKDSGLLSRWREKFPRIPYVTARLDVELPLLLLQHNARVTSATFSPDGTLIVSGSYDSTVGIWDPSTGSQLTVLSGHNHLVSFVNFSPDGRQIISASHDHTVRIWELSTKKELRQLNHDSFVSSVGFSPDGTYIASASHDCSVRVWDGSTGKEIHKINGHTMDGHTHWVTSASFSPDGNHIVSGSYDSTVRMWDVSTGKGRQIIPMMAMHKKRVNTVCFSPDGVYAASGSHDSSVIIWVVATWGEFRQLMAPTSAGDVSCPITSVCFSPEGKNIIAGTGRSTVLMWDVSTGMLLRKLHGHKESVSSVGFSPDGARIISASYDHTVKVWDVLGFQGMYPLDGHDESVTSVCFSPNGRNIASGSHDGTVCVWDALTGRQMNRLVSHGDRVNSVSFSLDGNYIISTSDDKAIRVWSALSGRELYKLVGHDSCVVSARFSPNGAQIASGGMDDTVRVWDVSTRRQLIEFRHDDRVNSVNYSPDGRYVVSTSHDRTVRVWDQLDGKQVLRLVGHDSSVNAASFSPDGTHLISGSDDCTLRLWDASTGLEVYRLDHDSMVSSVDCLPRGLFVVFSSGDRSVRVWDISAGTLRQLDSHGSAVTSVNFSPDRIHIVSGSEDGTVRVWNRILVDGKSTFTSQYSDLRHSGFWPWKTGKSPLN